MTWHRKDTNRIFSDLRTSSEGLSSGEAAARLKQYGPNELIEKKGKSPFRMFLDQFRDFMILVLIAAAVIAGFIGDLSDTIAIVVIVIVNAVIGFVQEYRAEKAMEALKKMAAPTATVLRDGQPGTAPASELVPGDLVVLEAGRIVPADMRLIETAHLKVEEAALTGESAPVEKSAEVLTEEEVPLGDRKNMAYKGTFVTYGRGAGIVAETAMNTEFGKIAAMLQADEEGKTPLQKRLETFGRKLALSVLVICVVVLGIGLLRGEQPLLMLLTAISLAVAAIPEALPAVITIALALGAKKLIKLKALIRKLPAVETLGSVTYICSDKTGTLTLNRMTVEELFFNGRRIAAEDFAAGIEEEGAASVFLSALALSNDAQAGNGGEVLGDPTETALYRVAEKSGYDKADLEKTHRRVAEIPFDSERKCMTTFHEWEGGLVSFTKGAVDVLVEKSRDMMMPESPMPIDLGRIKGLNESMAAGGMRVLCFAMRRWDRLPDDMSPGNVEKEMTMIGLVGMIDPPREEAGAAVALCRSAGIKTVMITGDHPATAQAIARKLGILDGDGQAVMTGTELEKLSLEEFEERVEHIRVYARVAPEQKLKIVKALQDRGQYVAMTGDGVNDAPALKRADIGIAMGITGTDVSKEAASMILLDDNFASIVNAVKEGRKIYDNIRKFVKYLLTTNSGEIWTLFLAPVVGLPIPLLPIQILWINLVTDGLPALALSLEPAEGDVMNRPPRHPQESIFAGGLGFHAIWVGLLMAGIVLFLLFWSIRTDNPHWQTMVFTFLCLTQLGNVLAIRSERESLFKIGLFSNSYLLGAVLLTFLLQMATVYVPVLNPVFKTVPLTLEETLFTVSLSSIVFFAVEIEKLVKRRKGEVSVTA
ncbi:Ca2+-transporting ATPase [Syntrophus gentianae]|uniref:Ca2+-transporting ATPase n=1 Tax=Syntrophus gentianae TaxID=43775 RepID=A0A1H7WLL7_9BACT|nr:cation-translocating P-type ATPase [Syntrophus gentianae]SEM22254.1 Ca2+-transporting ATPase [Syntrophus gentianae]